MPILSVTSNSANIRKHFAYCDQVHKDLFQRFILNTHMSRIRIVPTLYSGKGMNVLCSFCAIFFTRTNRPFDKVIFFWYISRHLKHLKWFATQHYLYWSKLKAIIVFTYLYFTSLFLCSVFRLKHSRIENCSCKHDASQ